MTILVGTSVMSISGRVLMLIAMLPVAFWTMRSPAPNGLAPVVVQEVVKFLVETF